MTTTKSEQRQAEKDTYKQQAHTSHTHSALALASAEEKLTWRKSALKKHTTK